ncbi:MAG: hypothetical protein BGO40_00800 [Chryseobacterium sp. 39-10]|mgnify:FL=1|nr:glycosyltransferase family 4 protein [Chryseobacterium sp.]OJV49410.1 MAG: hypothetical protein BGO40_00800 [Chryseobacterium sp. 39-10]
MHKKRILVFINYFGKKSETFISDEIEFLSSQKDVDVTILHYGKDSTEKKVMGLYFESNFTKRWLKALRKFDLKMFATLRYKNGLNGSLVSLIPFFRKSKFDTIYCHFGTNGKLIAELKQLKVIPKVTKLVVRFHGLDMNFTKYPVGFYDILNSYADEILLGSQFAYKDLRTYRLNKEKLNKLPVGIMRKHISKEISDFQPEQFNIISVGRLIDLKGYLVALDIINEINKRSINFTYTIIGDGPQYDILSEVIERYTLQNKVKIIKSLDHANVLDILQKSQIYLYPGIRDQTGRAETQGLANLEAMANGLVIVASDIGGVPDYVVHNKTGFLCEPGNVNQFVEKLQWIMQNYSSDEIVKVRQNAITEVENNYCQEKLNEKLLNLLID